MRVVHGDIERRARTPELLGRHTFQGILDGKIEQLPGKLIGTIKGDDRSSVFDKCLEVLHTFASDTAPVHLGNICSTLFSATAAPPSALEDSIDRVIRNDDDIIVLGNTRGFHVFIEERRERKIEILEQSFEDYIKTADNKFDTAYVDLWEDSDPRYLPYINRLVELIKPLCKDGGRIYTWTYAMMVDAFVKLIHFYETSDIYIQKIPASIDPLLTKYGQWRALEENDSLSIAEYEKILGGDLNG